MEPEDFDVDAAALGTMVSGINPLIGSNKRETMDAVALVLDRLAAWKDADEGIFGETAEGRTAESHLYRTLAAALTFDPERAIDSLGGIVHGRPSEKRATAPDPVAR